MRNRLTWFGLGLVWLVLVTLSALLVMAAAHGTHLDLSYPECLGLSAVANILPGAVWFITDT